MKRSTIPALLAGLSMMLSACGGGGGNGASAGNTASAPPTPAPPSSTGACALSERKNWAAGVLREHYLFPETLPASLDPAPYTSVDAYIDALTATARGQRRDRFFTYLTSIAEENAFFSSGSSAGIGIRIATDATARTATVTEAFEGAPGLAVGIDRGTEILAIGTTAGSLRPVSEIITAEGVGGVSAALGPTTAGTTRILRVSSAAGPREVSVTKTDYALTPVSSRYGSRIIDDGGKRVGYLNLRTFISTADPQLRAAFDGFRAQGVTEFVIDFRYNGGGLVSTAELIGDLLGRNRTRFDVLSYTTFRPEKASRNETRFFAPQPESVAPVRIAFIGTGGTASASELVINAFIPYLRSSAALIGSNTFGKPVGQIAIDRAACDDRLRVVAFATQNSARSAAYFDGLASVVEASCQAKDDLTRQFGDPQEASTRQALDYLAGKTCTPIATGQSGQSVRAGGALQLLTPLRASTAQREVPGLF